MQIEKKLILCSILAVAIGIASIAPLTVFMQTANAQETNDIPWFNAKIQNANFKATIEKGTDTMKYGTEYGVGLDFALNPEAENCLKNARSEYFLIQIYSDLGPIQNITEHFGANIDDNSDPTQQFYFARNDWFNTSSSGGGGCFLKDFNGTLAEVLAKELGRGGSGGSSSTTGPTDMPLPEEFLNAHNAQTIFVDLRRIGYVTFEGNNTIVTLADSSIVIDHVELTRKGSEFVYGDASSNTVTPKP